MAEGASRDPDRIAPTTGLVGPSHSLAEHLKVWYIVCDHGYARTRYRLLLLLLLCVSARSADELLYAGSHVEGHDKGNKTEWDVAGEEQEALLGSDRDAA